MILALRLILKKNHHQKRLCNGEGGVSSWCQDDAAKQAGWPCCAAMGPLLLPYMAIDSVAQAQASLISSLFTLLFLRMSSLLFQLSNTYSVSTPTSTEYWFHDAPQTSSWVFSPIWITLNMLYLLISHNPLLFRHLFPLCFISYLLLRNIGLSQNINIRCIWNSNCSQAWICSSSNRLLIITPELIFDSALAIPLSHKARGHWDQNPSFPTGRNRN